MQQSVQIIKDSTNKHGKRITTLLVNHWRGIHPEMLKHRVFSTSTSSSRAIPFKTTLKQVTDDPMMPILWPKEHKNMQGSEVFIMTDDNQGIGILDIEHSWLQARNKAVEMASQMSHLGLSKQLCNRLLEPFVCTKMVLTSTEWSNFFKLRHPWHEEIHESTWNGMTQKTKRIVFEDQVNLTFPAEYNIQDVAIKIKQAMDSSTPTMLETDQWHLPFVDSVEGTRENILLSASKCARTSYGNNSGKSIEEELKLAERLIKDSHFSPLEHIAQCIDIDYITDDCPEGLAIIKTNSGVTVTSGNLVGWLQFRKLVDSGNIW